MEKMTGVLAQIEEFIERPHEAAARAAQAPRISLALLGYLLGAVSLSFAHGGSGTLDRVAAACVLGFLWHVGSGCVESALSHLAADALGGRGRALSLFVLFGLSDLAWASALPVTLILRALFPDSAWAVTLATGIIGCQVLFYRARSLSDNYGLSPLSAWIALFLPWAAMILAAFLGASVAAFELMRRLIQHLA